MSAEQAFEESWSEWEGGVPARKIGLGIGLAVVLIIVLLVLGISLKRRSHG